MQFPSGATAIRLATGARAFRESATKKPLTGGKLCNAGTEVALRGGEFAAVQGVSHLLYLLYVQDNMESQEQIDNANLLLTQHRLKLEWNQMVWSANNLRCGIVAAPCTAGTPIFVRCIAVRTPDALDVSLDYYYNVGVMASV